MGRAKNRDHTPKFLFDSSSIKVWKAVLEEWNTSVGGNLDTMLIALSGSNGEVMICPNATGPFEGQSKLGIRRYDFFVPAIFQAC
jgi:hypothetical protein